jgi:ADP-heptose:LPS heptosyltransferase
MAGGNHILIIKLGALGDMVLATPHLKAVVEAYPEADVTLLTSPPCAGLVHGLPGLKVVAFKRRGFAEMWHVFTWLRRQRFSVVFDLQGSLRSRLMTRCSGARQRIGGRPAFAYTQVPVPDGENRHAFDALNRLLDAAGIDPAPPRAWLPASAAIMAAVDHWLERRGLAQQRRILLHAGCSERWPSKRWEESHFETLALAIAERGYAVIWIGANDDRDVNRRLARQIGVDATAAFSAAGLAAFAVVNDSAPMHILSAATLPVYALFGPTDWRRSHGLGQAERVLFNPVDCSPCHQPVCPPGFEHRCLRELTPAQVLSRLAADGWFGPA